jgi:hypothetical protein
MDTMLAEDLLGLLVFGNHACRTPTDSQELCKQKMQP